LFGSSGGRKEGKHGPRKGKDKNVAGEEDQSKYMAGKDASKGADRELYQYTLPSQSLGMSELIKDHVPGDRFLYCAVTGHDEESQESRLRRLVSFKPALRRKVIPFKDLPVIPLYQETETFPISSLLKKATGGAYILISDCIVLYGSLIPADAAFSKVSVGIRDSRLIRDKMAKSVTVQTNNVSKANMSLSHCFPRKEADAISLVVSREVPFLEPGCQWGVIQIQLVIEEMDFPIQTDNLPIAAINAITKSALEEHTVNPNVLDITIVNSDLRHLREMHMNNDLADETEPVANKTAAVQYAKSSLAGPKGKKKEQAGSGWEFMNNKRIGLEDADNVSVDPEDSGSVGSYQPPTPPLRSAMKKGNRPKVSFSSGPEVSGPSKETGTTVAEGGNEDDEVIQNSDTDKVYSLF
jgi:hypothetical protein